MINTYEDNENITLEYPYAAKDSNNNLFLILGPASMTPANALRIDDTGVIPFALSKSQINALTLKPAGVTITLKVEPQFGES